MIYQISYFGFGSNHDSVSHHKMATAMGGRRYCFDTIRSHIVDAVRNFFATSRCFDDIVYTIHIGRTDGGGNNDLKEFSFSARDILKWRGVSDGL